MRAGFRITYNTRVTAATIKSEDAKYESFQGLLSIATIRIVANIRNSAGTKTCGLNLSTFSDLLKRHEKADESYMLTDQRKLHNKRIG